MRRTDCGASLTNYEKYSVILGVYPAIRPERQRRVSRTERQLEEQLRLQLSALLDHIHVAVFTVDVNHAVRVNSRRVDAPLVTVGMLLIDGRVLEAPLGLKIGADLGHFVRSWRKRLANGIVGEVAIESSRIMIILDDDRVGAIVRIYRRC